MHVGDARTIVREIEMVASPLRALILGHRLVREVSAGRLPRPKLKNFLAQMFYRVRHLGDLRISLALRIDEDIKDHVEAKKLCLQMAFGDLNQHQIYLKVCRAVALDINGLLQGSLLQHETERELAWERWLLAFASAPEACAAILFVPLTVQIRLYPKLLEALTSHYGLSQGDAEYFHMNGAMAAPREEAAKRLLALLIRDERAKARVAVRVRQALEGMAWWLTAIEKAPGL